MTTRFMNRGYEDAVDLFACTALANHCVAADPFALVRDTIKSSVVISIYEKAQKAAAEAISSNSDRLSQELIDAADDQSTPEAHPASPPPPRRGRPPRTETARTVV